MMLSPNIAHVQRALYHYTKSIILYIIQNLIYLYIIIKQVSTSKMYIFNNLISPSGILQKCVVF